MKHPLQQAEFLITAASDDQLPPSGPPEVAFAGRSNAGKSSAINALANQTRLAFTSKTPGRTQQINLFRLPSGGLLADLPGYGYAAVPRELKRHWQEFLARYLATRQALVGLALVIDARHGIADLDRALLGSFLPSGRPVLILATKMDKLTSSAQRTAQRSIERDVAAAFPAQAAQVTVVPFSATRQIGIATAEGILGGWLGVEGTPAIAAEASPGDDSRRTKEKAPRSRGVSRGPKRPARG
ncbi:MAG: ribosome biogenesis GTP-binding protein YihA/YsxC [Betaproteobacteria bacterium]